MAFVGTFLRADRILHIAHHPVLYGLSDDGAGYVYSAELHFRAAAPQHPTGVMMIREYDRCCCFLR